MKRILIVIFVILLYNNSFSQNKITIVSGSNPLCQGNSVTLKLTQPGGNSVPATWYIGDCHGTLIGGSDSYYGFTVSPSKTTTYTAVYTPCVSNGKACACSISASITIDVVIRPDIPTKPTGGVNICKNTVSTVYHTTIESGVQWDLDWQIIPTNALLRHKIGGTYGTDTIIWNPAFSGDAQISVRSYSSSCGYSDYSTPLNVNVQSTAPATPIASNNGPVCTGNTLSLNSSTISGATYYWSGPNGFSSTAQNPTVSSNATIAMAGSYNVEATVNGCSTKSGSTTVIINQATVGNNGPVCTGSKLSLSASTIPGATYYWSGPNGFSSTAQNPTVSTNATSAMAGVYSVYTTANGCTSPVPGITTVVVNPITNTPTTGNNGPVCVGSTLSLTSSTISGASYLWTGPNNFTSTLQNPVVSTSATTAMNGVYSVFATVDGCASVAGTTAVEINKITASNNAPVCVGNTLSLSATSVSGATYFWTGPNGFTSNDQNPIVSKNATISMGGLYSVTSTVNGCTSAASVTIVTINPAADLPTTTSPVTYCQNSRATSLIAAGTNLKWYTNATGGNGSTIAPTPDTSIAGTKTYYVSQTNSCESPRARIDVVVNALPTIAGAITGTSTVCQGQNSVTYSIPTIANAASYIWSLPAGAIGTSNINTITINYSLSAISGNITVNGHNDCGDGVSSTLLITVNPLPTKPIITQNGDVLHSTSISGNQWYNSNGFISGATSQDYKPKTRGDYYVVVSSFGCNSEPSNSIHLIPTGINPIIATKTIKIYPNPATNELTIEIEGNTNNTEFEILNSNGQVVFTGTLVEKTVVQTTSYTPGIYLVKLKSGDTFEFKKILKN